MSKRKKDYFASIGRLGGPARAAALSPRKRRAIAKKAAAARWGKRDAKP